MAVCKVQLVSGLKIKYLVSDKDFIFGSEWMDAPLFVII